jgi:hypothetical protein
MRQDPTTLHGGLPDANDPATPQARPGRKWAAFQVRPHPAEQSRSPTRSPLDHRHPSHPGRPVGSAGSLHRPPRGPDWAQGESRHDGPAGVRAFSGDPLNWQKGAIARGDDTRVARNRPSYCPLAALPSFLGHNPPSRVTSRVIGLRVESGQSHHVCDSILSK